MATGRNNCNNIFRLQKKDLFLITNVLSKNKLIREVTLMVGVYPCVRLGQIGVGYCESSIFPIKEFK